MAFRLGSRGRERSIGATLEARFDRAMETQIARILDEAYSFERLFSHIQGIRSFDQATLPLEVIRDSDVRAKIDHLLDQEELDADEQTEREAEITRWRIDRFRAFLAYCDKQVLEPEQEEAIARRTTARKEAFNHDAAALRSGELSGMALLGCIADSRFEDVWREAAVWECYRPRMEGNGPVAKQLRALYERIGVDDLSEEDAAA